MYTNESENSTDISEKVQLIFPVHPRTKKNLETRVVDILTGSCEQKSVPELWDGRTAGRVVNSIKKTFKRDAI